MSSLVLACGPPGPLDMKVNYAPTETLETGGVPGSITETPVQIGDIVEQRNRPEGLLGRYEDGGESSVVRASSESMRSTVGHAMEENLRTAGVQLVRSAPTQLDITIVDMWVKEANTYQAVVRLKVQIVRNGRVVDSVLVDGTASRWGETMTAENYRKVISDALLDLTRNLLKTPTFVTALSSGGTEEAIASPAEGS